MNNKKICFITVINDEITYEECLFYIKNLNIPDGYEIEIIGVRDAYCMGYAYNKAMENSDAKYKVYLKQDTLIINKNFIYDILKIFNNDSIGMIGVCGSGNLPTNGVWWESKSKVGKIYDSCTGKMEEHIFNQSKKEYEKVQVIDGLIMITQYDIEWRYDIFDGWHFYDISQSVEFINKGYEVIVPKQIKPWCIYECGIVNTDDGYEKYRNIFLNEYSKTIYPLVSILIPAYNRPSFLKQALDSAINQTYRNIEILIGDDSTNSDVKELIESNYIGIYDNVKYFYNNGPLGRFGLVNISNLIEKSKGEYINVLMDDDLFKYDKIEKMMNYYIQNDNISLVTSKRTCIDENGNILPDIYETRAIVSEDTVFRGKYIGKLLLETQNNFIGEPTTALIKKESISKNIFGMYLNKEFEANIDITQWLQCCTEGNIVYISEPLSYFRMHEGQNQRNTRIIIKSIIDVYEYVQLSLKNNLFITNNYMYTNIMKLWLNRATNFISIYEKKDNDYYKLKKMINDAKKVFGNHMCNICGSELDAFLPYRNQDNSEEMEKFNIIGSDINNFSCPICSATDRERHLFIYFDKLEIFDKIKKSKVLHIAPENQIYKKLVSLNPVEYVCGDLFPEHYKQNIDKIDLTNIKYADNYFDIVICNHVLEHIPDDIKAMSEMYRVLNAGGIAILQTPFASNLKNTFENEQINTDDLRLRYYGQEDHIRVYGLDLFERIKSVGFKLNIIKSSDIISDDICEYLGMNKEEELIMVKKM